LVREREEGPLCPASSEGKKGRQVEGGGKEKCTVSDYHPKRGQAKVGGVGGGKN